MTDLTTAQIAARLRACKFRVTDEDGCSWEAEPPPEHDALLAWVKYATFLEGVTVSNSTVMFDLKDDARDAVTALLEGSDG